MTDNHPTEQPVHLPIGTIVLDGDLTVPSTAAGVVLFAHGSGSSPLSPPNRHVAAALQEHMLLTRHGKLVGALVPAEEVETEPPESSPLTASGGCRAT